jgi:hypothetical protein
VRIKLLLLVLWVVGACTSVMPTPVASPSLGCQATDQDQYVYNPDRLTVQAACVHVTGIVDFIRTEPDGDYHIGLKLDSQYVDMVNSCNSTCVNGAEHGDLVVEPICANPVSQADAISDCAADKDPLIDVPSIGQHVWMDGRYVLDNAHGWEELHPLYAWGQE